MASIVPCSCALCIWNSIDAVADAAPESTPMGPFMFVTLKVGSVCTPRQSTGYIATCARVSRLSVLRTASSLRITESFGSASLTLGSTSRGKLAEYQITFFRPGMPTRYRASWSNEFSV